MATLFAHVRILACIITLVGVSAFGAAITSTWTDGNGNWSVAGNWDNGVPNNGGGNTYTAVLSNGSSVHLDIPVTINNLTIDSVDALTVSNNVDLALSSISNNGHLTVDSGSTLDNTGFTYTQTGNGTTTNVNGTLKANLVDIQGGLLEGMGTITGNLVLQGRRLNPGNSPGTFDVSGNYTQTAGGTLDIELGAFSFDKLVLTGSGTFAGALDISSFGGFTPSDGEVFRIITFSSLISDGFSPPTSFIPNFTFTQTAGATFIDLTAHQSIAGVPEPSTLLLLAAGLAALLLIQRRRQLKTCTRVADSR